MSSDLEYPHLFAAAACLAGASRDQREQNLLNLPLLILHGLDDPIVRYDEATALNVMNLRNAGAPVTLATIPATGHGLSLTGVEDWLLRQQRQPTPTRVIGRTRQTSPQPLRNHWVTLLALIWPHEQAAVTADAHDRQIRVTTANVDEAALDLVDLRRAGLTIDAVEVDGQTLAAPPADYAHLRRREHRWRIDGCDARPEFDRTRYEAGGLTTLYQRGSLLIVAQIGRASCRERV